jgi:type II secretory pathway component PulK
MTRNANRQTGFAMVTAIFLMSLVTMTLTLLIAGISGDARRTQTLSEDAQLRQLLLAGTEIARSQLPATISQTTNLPTMLPTSLQQQSAALKITIQSIQSPTDIIIEIEASVPRHKMTDQVHLTQSNGHWEVISSSLNN